MRPAQAFRQHQIGEPPGEQLGIGPQGDDAGGDRRGGEGRRPLQPRQLFDLRAKVGERRAVPMEPELVDDSFEPVLGCD